MIRFGDRLNLLVAIPYLRFNYLGLAEKLQSGVNSRKTKGIGLFSDNFISDH
jgi:hypothetical protein